MLLETVAGRARGLANRLTLGVAVLFAIWLPLAVRFDNDDLAETSLVAMSTEFVESFGDSFRVALLASVAVFVGSVAQKTLVEPIFVSRNLTYFNVRKNVDLVSKRLELAERRLKDGKLTAAVDSVAVPDRHGCVFGLLHPGHLQALCLGYEFAFAKQHAVQLLDWQRPQGQFSEVGNNVVEASQ